jgi:phytoene desaturase
MAESTWQTAVAANGNHRASLPAAEPRADVGRTIRAAVIGSGFGGLSLAIRLQAAGVRTVLFEARDKPGGRAYVYQDRAGSAPGEQGSAVGAGVFTFDAGPTVITAPAVIEELFALAGERMEDSVELLPVSPFYRLVWPDGVVLDYEGDAERMREQITQLAPTDVEGYERFLRHSGEVFAAGYEGLAATPFLRFADMVRVAPQLARLRADRTVYDTVSRFVSDEHLREALSFHSLLIGGNPLRRARSTPSSRIWNGGGGCFSRVGELEPWFPLSSGCSSGSAVN